LKKKTFLIKNVLEKSEYCVLSPKESKNPKEKLHFSPKPCPDL